LRETRLPRISPEKSLPSGGHPGNPLAPLATSFFPFRGEFRIFIVPF
jgi:hypothetical protein